MPLSKLASTSALQLTTAPITWTPSIALNGKWGSLTQDYPPQAPGLEHGGGVKVREVSGGYRAWVKAHSAAGDQESSPHTAQDEGHSYRQGRHPAVALPAARL